MAIDINQAREDADHEDASRDAVHLIEDAGSYTAALFALAMHYSAAGYRDAAAEIEATALRLASVEGGGA